MKVWLATEQRYDGEDIFGIFTTAAAGMAECDAQWSTRAAQVKKAQLGTRALAEHFGPLEWEQGGLGYVATTWRAKWFEVSEWEVQE